MSANNPRIVIVGAGIIGSTLAWHLARRGADVTLIDAGQPGSGVTGGAFGWICVSHDQPEPLMALRHLATHEWRRLQRDLGERLEIDWCGALTWSSDPADAERLVRNHAACGYDVRLMERSELIAREPNLIDPPEVAAFAPIEGAIDAGPMTAVIAQAAREAGAVTHFHCSAQSLATTGGRVTGVRTAQGTLEADVVVLAAGTAIPALAEGLGDALPVESSPALLLRFHAPRRLVHTILNGPAVEMRDGGPGALRAADDFGPGSDADAIARDTLAAIRRTLRGAEEVTVASAEVGRRPMPADGLPIIGFQPGLEGLYVTAMHAAVTLAPTVGRLAAAEILDGVTVAMLENLRPGRA